MEVTFVLPKLNKDGIALSSENFENFEGLGQIFVRQFFVVRKLCVLSKNQVVNTKTLLH